MAAALATLFALTTPTRSVITGLTDQAELTALKRTLGGRLLVVASATDGDERSLVRGADVVLSPHRSAGDVIPRLLRGARGDRTETPARDEAGMFLAFATSLRSAGQRGGVGAAIVDDLGELLATGMNETPAPGGGQYWPDHPEDARDFVQGEDPATSARLSVVRAVLDHLAESGLDLPGDRADLADGFVASLDRAGRSGLGTGTVGQAFESLGRVVHAELAALLNAGRHGVPVRQATVYVTSPPCRQCTRHLVAAGIARIVYLGPRTEPPAFHADALDATGAAPGRVAFEPFGGVTPWLYARVFANEQQAFGASERRLRDDIDDHEGERLRLLQMTRSIDDAANALARTIDLVEPAARRSSLLDELRRTTGARLPPPGRGPGRPQRDP